MIRKVPEHARHSPTMVKVGDLSDINATLLDRPPYYIKPTYSQRKMVSNIKAIPVVIVIATSRWRYITPSIDGLYDKNGEHQAYLSSFKIVGNDIYAMLTFTKMYDGYNERMIMDHPTSFSLTHGVSSIWRIWEHLYEIKNAVLIINFGGSIMKRSDCLPLECEDLLRYMITERIIHHDKIQ